MQVNISLVTHVDININKFLLSLVFLRLEVGSNRIFFGSHRLEIQNLQPRLDPIQKIWARAQPDPEKTGSTHLQKLVVVRKYKQNLNYCASLMFLSSPGKSKLSFLLAEESIYFSNNCICDDNNENKHRIQLGVSFIDTI